MRTIYFVAMCLWLNACTTATLFPLETKNNITTDPSVIKAWKQQASYTSGVNFGSTKVQLGGRITQVIPKPGGVVILAEEQPIDRFLGYGPTTGEREGAFKYAIVFPGFPDDDMLKAGNQLAVVGELDGSRPEGIGSTPKLMLPHLFAQCLHLWKTEGFESDNFPYEGSMGYYPLEKRTFCRKEDNGRNLSSSNDHRFRVPRATGGLHSVDSSVTAHKIPAASQNQDVSLGKY